jgi:hypothetical protein
MNAPVQIDATRRTLGAIERAHSTRDGSMLVVRFNQFERI